jgi:hypothetical protein
LRLRKRARMRCDELTVRREKKGRVEEKSDRSAPHHITPNHRTMHGSWFTVHGSHDVCADFFFLSSDPDSDSRHTLGRTDVTVARAVGRNSRSEQ